MKYRRVFWTVLTLVLVAALALAGCSKEEAPTPAASSAGEAGEPSGPATLDDAYSDALGIPNQLLLGILRLDSTPNAITPEQARRLLPLWQAFKALTGSNTAATEEMEAVQNQILSAMSQDQVAAIAGMQLTNADLAAYYAELGLSQPVPPPGITPGSMRDLPPEEQEAARATAQAALGASAGTGGGNNSQRNVLLDNVIELLAAP